MPKSEMSCPVCQASLQLDRVALVRGEKVTCGTCDTAIGIEPGGSTKAALDAFEAARRSLPAHRKAG